MYSKIIKQTTICLDITQDELLNIMKGGVTHIFLKASEIMDFDEYTESCQTDQIQLNVKVNQADLKSMDFMRVYLENRGKHEQEKK